MIMHDRKTRWSLGLAPLLLAVGMGMMIWFSPDVLRADEPVAAVNVGFQNGTITGIYETTLQIDHKTYSLTPDVALLDRHGDVLAARYLQVDIEVRYHLEKGSKDRIDRMILLLPE
jgi:hypothetical protein